MERIASLHNTFVLYSPYERKMRTQYPTILSKQGILLSLILLTVGFIYIYRIGDKSLDLDERYSMNIATGAGGSTTKYVQFGRFISNPIAAPTFTSAEYKERYRLSNVVSTAMNDNGQGLPYFIMLHAWLKAFGITTVHARLLSVLLLLITLLLSYRIMLRCGIETKLALLIMALFGCNGVVIGLAQYVRFYSLGVLLSVVSCNVVLRIQRGRPARWSAGILGIVWGLMFLNQFFSVFIILAEGLYLLNGDWKRNLRRVVFPAALGLLLPVAIWLLPLHGWESLRNIYVLQSHQHQAIYSLSVAASPLNVALGCLSSFASALGQPVNMLGGTVSTLLQITPAIPAFLLIGIIMSSRNISRAAWIKLSLYALGIYLIASVAHSSFSGYTLLFQGRYWVFAYLFSYLLLAWALTKSLRGATSIKWLAVSVIILTCGRAFYTSASAVSGLAMTSHGKLAPVYIQPNEDYEGMAGSLIIGARQGDTVSFQSWKLAQCTNWFLLHHPDIIQRVDTAQATAVTICNGPTRTEVPFDRGRTSRARRVWLR
jgi:hypothetical protein